VRSSPSARPPDGRVMLVQNRYTATIHRGPTSCNLPTCNLPTCNLLTCNLLTPLPTYSAFGLAIDSELELADLPAGVAAPDTTVRFGAIPPRADTVAHGDQRRVAVDVNAVTIFWDGFGAVRIAGGAEIVVDRAPGVDDGFYRQIVQNIALGVALHQRGVFTLHGSAIALPAGAVGFVGWKGAGKSTAASALYARGHTLVADDVMAIDTAQSPPRVMPGIPSMKLWPASVQAALGEDAGALPALFETTEKRIREVSDRFATAPQPLRRIYVLAFGGDAPRIEPLSPREALIELVSQSYALRFIGNRGADRSHLQHAQRLASQGLVARLTRPRNLASLEHVAETIEDDIAQRSASAEYSSTPEQEVIPAQAGTQPSGWHFSGSPPSRG